MAKKVFYKELAQLQKYLESSSSENAKRQLLYPLFYKLFGQNMKIENDSCGADIYIEGQLLVESKSTMSQWLNGFYQALHYHKRFGLAYSTIMVIAHEFVGFWKLNKIPEFAACLANTADSTISPSDMGKINAQKTKKEEINKIKEAAFYWLEPNDLVGDINTIKDLLIETYEILKILKNLDSSRLQINPRNFIQVIERMKPLFNSPIEAIHAFYTIVNYWDITSTVPENEYSKEIRVVGYKGQKLSESVSIPQHKYREFKKFIENQYVFVNEGSGLTPDHYFSRFDEVIAVLDPEYAKQHGIFFTDSNLSKFAMWFVFHNYKKDLGVNYIVFDPAGGSGNLVTSWHGNLRHKIVSELQPDLLKTIEKRMKIDPYHVGTGYTIIPRTSNNIGLNFLSLSAEEYLSHLIEELDSKHLEIDKPFAFLLNPPYKNIKENVLSRENSKSNYEIDKEILSITGPEASNERYLAFLGQILLMSKYLQDKKNLKSLVLIFTPTSWLIPRVNFTSFRNTWDKTFKFEKGFIITSNEFFKLDGKWPLAFTIWSYDVDHNRSNQIILEDYTFLKKKDLNINWNDKEKIIDFYIKKLTKGNKDVNFSRTRISLREKHKLDFYDFIRDPTKKEKESGLLFGGLPLNDERRRTNKKTYGVSESSYIGFLDNNTPCRIKPRGLLKRFSPKNLKSVWFRLDTALKDKNKAKCLGGPSDTRSYCAFDLKTAQSTFSWFAICKSLKSDYPLWANQFDIWSPKITNGLKDYWFSLCFSYVLAENRCIVTKFEKDNPVYGQPEVFVDNPMAPNNSDSFWSIFLDKEIKSSHNAPLALVNKVKELYTLWNMNYCHGQILTNVGLRNEPYFKYFSYPDFLTPHSGLIQIKKFAEQEGKGDLLSLFREISNLTKIVEKELYDILVHTFKYFE